jgi:hypothetical protein
MINSELALLKTTLSNQQEELLSLQLEGPPEDSNDQTLTTWSQTQEVKILKQQKLVQSLAETLHLVQAPAHTNPQHSNVDPKINSKMILRISSAKIKALRR